jgi:hypothetical protein
VCLSTREMREYALKREALHNWLVTDKESHAHQDALRRLAGLSLLTMPWRIQTHRKRPMRRSEQVSRGRRWPPRRRTSAASGAPPGWCERQ